MEMRSPYEGHDAEICHGQLNVVDDAGGSFAFPRFAVLIKEAEAATPPQPQADKPAS